MGIDNAHAPSAPVSEFDPDWGPRVCEFVSSSPVGSFQRLEFVKDAREGVRFARFVLDRPWPRAPSGFLDVQQLDVDAAFYAAQHCGSVSLARRSFVRYEAFCVANAHRLRSPDPYQSVSADVIAEFLRDVGHCAYRCDAALHRVDGAERQFCFALWPVHIADDLLHIFCTGQHHIRGV